MEGNELWETSIFEWPSGWTEGSLAESNGVVLTDAVCRGNVIRGTRFSGTLNGVGPCREPAPVGSVTAETDVSENSFAQHTFGAFEGDGCCANVQM